MNKMKHIKYLEFMDNKDNVMSYFLLKGEPHWFRRLAMQEFGWPEEPVNGGRVFGYLRAYMLRYVRALIRLQRRSRVEFGSSFVSRIYLWADSKYIEAFKDHITILNKGKYLVESGGGFYYKKSFGNYHFGRDRNGNSVSGFSIVRSGFVIQNLEVAEGEGEGEGGTALAKDLAAKLADVVNNHRINAEAELTVDLEEYSVFHNKAKTRELTKKFSPGPAGAYWEFMGVAPSGKDFRYVSKVKEGCH